VLEEGADNAGFYSFYSKKDLSGLFANLPGDNIVIFGEWCGGNIQKNLDLALYKLPKMFVIFSIQIDHVWQRRDVIEKITAPSLQVRNIYEFPSEQIEIDFNTPEVSQNKLVELTIKVETQCPVGQVLGVVGIGEGIVWKCITPGYENPKFSFKVKGVKHAGSGSKPTTMAAVNAEAVASVRAFAELTVTEERCRQAIDKLKVRGVKTDRSCLGAYLQLVNEDIVKEESDTAKASNIDLKKATSEINKVAKAWFFSHELEFN
jgi:RNA ligase